MKKLWSGSFRRRLFWAFLAAAMIPLLLCAGSLLQIFRLRLTDAARTEAQAHLNSALYAVESAYDGFHRAAERLADDQVVMAALTGGPADSAQVYNSLFQAVREVRSYARFDLYDSAVWDSYGVSPRANMERNFDVCRDFARQFSRGSGSLLLSGGTGLGKTFLSACIAREVSDAGFSVVYDTAISVFSRYEDAKFRPDEVSDADVRRCESCDLLILDDLGTEMTTAFVQSALYQIVNGRMLSGRSTIISTNLAPEELGHRYGAPILSRIEGAYQILPFFGEDIRTKQ